MVTVSMVFSPDRVCEEHGIWGTLPCPWPSCQNGIADDCFQLEKIWNGEFEMYKRRKWRSPIGESYFTWESDRLPNWFTVPQTFWNEARRLKLTPTYSAPLVYHYTTLEGFVGIVENGSIWLSDYSFLNDRRELLHGVEIIREEIRDMLRLPRSTDVADLLHHWDKEIAEPVHRVCIASFSAANDSLSQWRAYGSIAIGVKPQHLPLHAHQTTLQPVVYNLETQRKLTTVYLNHMAQAYETDLAGGRLKRIPEAYHKCNRLVELAAFFKDPAFKTEEEFRLAYIEDAESLRALGISSPPKRFRISKSRLLPYVASNELFPRESGGASLEIEEVVLGPETDELFERGIREFLASCNMAGVANWSFFSCPAAKNPANAAPYDLSTVLDGYLMGT